VNLHALRNRFDGLDALLRAEGMACGVDVWQSVFLLLGRLERQGRLPDDASALASLLGPLFCRNPEDQARFPVIFQQWLHDDAATVPAVASVNRIHASGQTVRAALQARLKKAGRIWLALLSPLSLLPLRL